MSYYNPFILFAKPASGGYDADAQAFFDATGISNTTIKDAVNDYVVDLKGFSLWSLLYRLFPFVGGTSATHAYDLKTATSIITWDVIGTGAAATHDSAGVTFTGTGQSDGSFGKTGVVPSTHLSSNDTGFAYYTASTDDRDNAVICGALISGSSLDMRFSNTPTTALSLIWGNGNITSTLTSINGMHSNNRTSSSATNYYNEGSLLDTFSSDTATTVPDVEIYLGGTNVLNAFASNMSTVNLSMWAAKTQAFNSTQEGNFYTATLAFQTALSRA